MQEAIMHTTLIVKDKKRVTLDGVKNVEGFDESYVSCATDAGKIIVEGHELKIESLTKNDGQIEITGKIDGVYYSAQKPAHGFFSKLFG